MLVFQLVVGFTFNKTPRPSLGYLTMIHYSKRDIELMDRVQRLTLINSITGIKPANLIGTVNSQGGSNLAIFSSIVHLGSDPALIGFILRPKGDVPRHTYENIKATGFYTINHVDESRAKNAHYTSAKFDYTTSEFVRCGLTEEYIADFPAPFVKESSLKFGLQFEENLDIKLNGTSLVIGSLQHLVVPTAFEKDLNLQDINSVGISGLNSYYRLQKIAHYPYARVSEVPKFDI